MKVSIFVILFLAAVTLFIPLAKGQLHAETGGDPTSSKSTTTGASSTDGDPNRDLHGAAPTGSDALSLEAASTVPSDNTKLTAQMIPCKDGACLKTTTMGSFTRTPCEGSESNLFLPDCKKGGVMASGETGDGNNL